MNDEDNKALAVVDGLGDGVTLTYKSLPDKPSGFFRPTWFRPQVDTTVSITLSASQIDFMKRAALNQSKFFTSMEEQADVVEITGLFEAEAFSRHWHCNKPRVVVERFKNPVAAGFTPLKLKTFLFCSVCGNCDRHV